jgi:hypothetical protein
MPANERRANERRANETLVGLKWSDLTFHAARLSISRTLQNVGGLSTEFGVTARTNRRCVDLDAPTLSALELASIE